MVLLFGAEGSVYKPILASGRFLKIALWKTPGIKTASLKVASQNIPPIKGVSLLVATENVTYFTVRAF